jgi:hypothetical protein
VSAFASVSAQSGPAETPGPTLSPQIPNDTSTFLPVIFNPQNNTRTVNAPYFSSSVNFTQTAIFWFGQVTPSSNYADVRIAYTQSELYVYIAVFDRLLWYDPAHTASDLTRWDATSLYLNLSGGASGAPTPNAYRFDAQLNWDQTPRTPWQAAYRGDGAGWTPSATAFTSVSGWRGNAINDAIDDRGWAMTYHIPFASLGLSTPPPNNLAWGLGIVLHDRDSQSGPPNPDEAWPETFQPNAPSTWGQLRFGMPAYAPPGTVNRQTVTIRNKLNGVLVKDGMVGGGFICGGGLQDFWNTWGNTNFAGTTDFNIQDQSDVADWPCFSKYFVTFPLSSLPPGKVIVSASLTLHEFGNSGDPGQAKPSWIQVMTVDRDWDETTLVWNNAPLTSDNFGGAWVDPLSSFPGWPGVPYTWDISRAVAAAYTAGGPLRLVLYSADSDYHSGKYFVSSDTQDWNETGRPTLQITLGDALK